MTKEINFYVLDSNEELITTLSSGEAGTHTPILHASVDEKADSYDVLTLQIPADDTNAGNLREDSVIVFKDIKGWREYVVTAVEELDGDESVATITAELSSIELLDEVLLKPYLVDSKDPERLLEDALEGTRWTVGYVDESLYNNSFNDSVKYMNVLEAINQLSSKFSAEISFSYTIDGNKIKDRFVNMYKQIGQDSGKRFEVDKDVSEITRTIDTTGIKTAIIAYGKEPEEAEEGQETLDRIDITNVVWSVANGDPVDKPAGQAYIANPEALEKWGKLNTDGSRRNRFMTMEIDADTEAEIATLAWVNLGRYSNAKITYEATVMDLYSLTGDEDYIHEKVNLGDTVVVIDNYFTSPLMVQSRIVEMVRDLLDPLQNELVLGDSKQTFKVGDIKQTVEDLASKVSQATYKASYAQLTGGGNYSYGGSQEPTGPNEGDTWFRPHPTVIGETQLLRYSGTLWNVELDTSLLAIVEATANEAHNNAQTAKETADGAVLDAQTALGQAQDAVTYTDEEITRIDTAFNVKLGSKVDDGTLTTELTAINGLIQNKVDSGDFTSYRTQTDSAIQDKVSSGAFSTFQTQTATNLNLRVETGDVVNQINISDEAILIDGTKLHITAMTTIDNAVITSAMIKELTADKLTAGTIDATNVSVINLTASNITGGDLNIKNVRVMNGAIPVIEVDGASNEVTMNVSKLTINAMDVANEIADTRTHADTVAQSEASGALTTARTYTDTTAGTTLTTANTHADTIANSEAGTALGTAKTYAESQAGTAESNAKTYASSKAGTAESNAKTYAGTVAGTAESNAKTYADTQVDAIEIGAVNLLVRHNEFEDRLINTEGTVGFGTGSALMEGFITVAPNEKLTFSQDPTLAGYFRWAWYRYDETYVSRIADTRSSFTWVVPTNTYLIRVSYQADSFPMLERGTKATGYSEAPEDVEARISAKTDQEVFEEMLEVLAEAKSTAEDAINSGTYGQFLDGYKEYQDLTEQDISLAKGTLETVKGTVATIENKLGNGAEKWDFLDTSITNSNGGMTITNEDSNMSLVVGAKRISFFDGGVEVAFISDKVLQINHGIFVKSAQIGAHMISSLPENSDITVVQWVGVPVEQL